MRRFLVPMGCVVVLLASTGMSQAQSANSKPATANAANSHAGNGHSANAQAAGSIVIVFKDGHREVFNLAEVDRVEFPGVAATAASPAASGAASAGKTMPAPRGRYVGKWEVGDGAGETFTITLDEDGHAFRSLGDVGGRWEYVNGDALITWDDGPHDAIRRVGSRFEKSAYAADKKFTDAPDNVASARNVTPRPI